MFGVRYMTAILLIPSALVALACLAETPPDSRDSRESADLLASSPFTEATFVYSNDPEKAIIFTSTMGMTRAQRTIGLYGDGRLVSKKLYGGQVAEESMVRVSHEDIGRLLRIAVDFGLVEWDLTRVQAKQLENNDGRLYGAIPSDSSRVVILLSLDRYERGEYRVSHLEKEVRFQGASFAERFYPPILEIRGILELQRELARLKKANQP